MNSSRWYKIIPILIFKGEPDWRIAIELEKHSWVENKQVFAYWDKKAWNNADIMKKMGYAVWRRYAHFKLKKKNMLVIDDASMHKIPEIKRSVELSETKVMMIQGALTRYFQPLDVSTNKPFKEEIRRKYYEYCIENTKFKVSRKQIIDWVGEIWNSEN